jgi:circadian clock protein KaiC
MFVYDLAVGMAAWAATTLLVGEYAAEEIGTAPEFAIADGIVQLTNERQELTAARQFEVLKLRGANYVTGRHFFEIGADGVVFYPRVRGPAITDDPPVDLADRVATGVWDSTRCSCASAHELDDRRGRHRHGQDPRASLPRRRAARRPGILFTLEETRPRSAPSRRATA